MLQIQENRKKGNTMKKVLTWVLTLMLLTGLLSTAAAQPETIDTDTATVGIRYTLPRDYSELEGTLVIQCNGVISYAPLIYCMDVMYNTTSKADLDARLDELRKKQSEDELTQEDLDAYNRTWLYIGVMLCSEMDMKSTVEAMGFLSYDAEKSSELATVDNLHFYYIAYPEEAGHQTYSELTASADARFVEEVNTVDADIRQALAGAEYFEPYKEIDRAEGQILSFESEDLAGNKVTSAELFSGNKITMVNVWGTWCGNCMNEMPELVEVHKEFQEKGCGIVGIEDERKEMDAAMREYAASVLESLGVSFPSVLTVKGNEVLDLVSGYPTTFFVDSEGKVLGKPIEGAAPDMYRIVMDSLLARQMPEVPVKVEEQKEKGTYRVIVTDEEGPVEEVTIQFCDDNSCSFGETDAEGVASFDKMHGVYEVHVLEVPDGYAEDETVYQTNATPGDIHIHLTKLP